jgi:C-terminal processing protease CtpA/Prc
MVKTEKFHNGSLTEGRFYSSLSNDAWQKKPGAAKNDMPAKGADFAFHDLSDSVHYMALRNFQASDANMARAKAFYDSVKTKLIHKYLVLDLRNNVGGAFKTSLQFLTLIKTYARDNKVYAIINCRTFSNGEQFVAELKRSENVITLGETTSGTLAYGANYGNWEKLASGRYMVYPTDMADTGNYLRFEEKGIDPDIFLKVNKDWIEQVLLYIKEH